MSSYTVIAYLSSARSMGSKEPLHVVDKEKTAKELSPIINMSDGSIVIDVIDTSSMMCNITIIT